MRVGKPTETHERVLVYGNPKVAGKTRFATSLPWGTYWGEKAVYVAADPGAISMRSVLPVHLEHLIPVEPRPEEGRKYDPLNEAVACVTRKWREEFGARTIIWDTLTSTAHDVLAAYARLGNYAKEQITFGKPGTPEFHAHPTPGDYGAAQNSVCEHVLGLLFQQPMHVIVVAHEQWVEPKNAGECVGGPATVGAATVQTLPRNFDAVIRLESKRVVDGKAKVLQFTAHTQPHGVWICGIRGAKAFPDTVLQEDPVHFWQAYTDALVS